MLLFLPRAALCRLLSLLLLATIGLQASEPVRGPHRDRGSAFSAATSDVVVASYRRPEAIRTTIAPLPPLPRLVETPFARTAAPLQLAAVPAPRPDSTGPPARMILARQPAPRAPPLA